MQHSRPINATLVELVLALGAMTHDDTLTTLLAHDLVATGEVVVLGSCLATRVH